jgi:hypothetical protein
VYSILPTSTTAGGLRHEVVEPFFALRSHAFFPAMAMEGTRSKSTNIPDRVKGRNSDVKQVADGKPLPPLPVGFQRRVLPTRFSRITNLKVLTVLALVINVLLLWPTFASTIEARNDLELSQWQSLKDYREYCINACDYPLWLPLSISLIRTESERRSRRVSWHTNRTTTTSPYRPCFCWVSNSECHYSNNDWLYCRIVYGCCDVKSLDTVHLAVSFLCSSFNVWNYLSFSSFHLCPTRFCTQSTFVRVYFLGQRLFGDNRSTPFNCAHRTPLSI